MIDPPLIPSTGQWLDGSEYDYNLTL